MDSFGLLHSLLVTGKIILYDMTEIHCPVCLCFPFTVGLQGFFIFLPALRVHDPEMPGFLLPDHEQIFLAIVILYEYEEYVTK